MAKAKKKYDGPIEAPSVQKMLARIAKRSAEKPLKDSELKGQYPKRIARRLASYKLVASEIRDGVGLVFFGKEPIKA